MAIRGVYSKIVEVSIHKFISTQKVDDLKSIV